jgi:hypothetical protein
MNCATLPFAASFFLFRQGRSVPTDRSPPRPAIRSTIAQSHDCCAPIRQTISHGIECSGLEVRLNFAVTLRPSREHACGWKGSSSVASAWTWSDLHTRFGPGRRSTEGDGGLAVSALLADEFDAAVARATLKGLVAFDRARGTEPVVGQPVGSNVVLRDERLFYR